MKTDKLFELVESIGTWPLTLVEHDIELARAGFEPHDTVRRLHGDMTQVVNAYGHALRQALAAALSDEVGPNLTVVDDRGRVVDGEVAAGARVAFKGDQGDTGTVLKNHPVRRSCLVDWDLPDVGEPKHSFADWGDLVLLQAPAEQAPEPTAQISFAPDYKEGE